MACACGKSKRGRWVVKLPGGLEVPKSSEAAAKTFSGKHPGSTVIKTA